MPLIRTEVCILIVLPIFNEEENLRSLLELIHETLAPAKVLYRVIAVNDGSTDGTADILTAMASYMPLKILHHRRNRGLGRAIRTGLIEAVRLAPSTGVVVTMDADGSHDPALIPQMAAAVGERFDIAIASRFQPTSRCVGVPVHRQILSLGASWLLRSLLPTSGVLDFTSGFRAYSVSALHRAVNAYGECMIESKGFECMVELLLNLRHLDCTFTEVPMVLRYDCKRSPSKMKILRTTWRLVRLVSSRTAKARV